MPSSGNITSSDVAEKAGVSQSTVSRVLTGSPRVSEETRNRVLKVVEELGYTPNAIARGLVTSRSGLVGVVSSDVTNPFYPQFLEAIRIRLAESNLGMLLWTTEVPRGELLQTLLKQRLDGVILTSAKMDSPILPKIIEHGIPVVMTNRFVDGVDADAAIGDNEAGAEAVAQHLVELGHRRIGVISGDPMTSTSRDRLKGFRAKLESLEVELDESMVKVTDYSFSEAHAAATELLEQRPRPTAIFALADQMALATMNVAKAKGLAVPSELSVVGFDDIWMASWEMFRLTTVHQPFAEMAQAAADLLVERFRDPGRSPRKLVFPSQLVVRDTTASSTSGLTREERNA